MQEVKISTNNKKELYKELLPQIESILTSETNLIANMANISAILKETFNFWWVGFYIIREESNKEELVLGPFQGPLACTRIQLGRGVCGTSWSKKQTIIVPDVELFPGHIACSSLSKSEIVVPVFNNSNNIIAVLDIDSKDLDTFNNVDAYYLEKIVSLLSK